jgi:hypothetical protein
MKWLMMSIVVMFLSACVVEEYDHGYQSQYPTHVHPSRDYYYHGGQYYRRGPRDVNVPVPAQVERQEQSSNYHGHDDGNWQGRDSVPGQTITIPAQPSNRHGHDDGYQRGQGSVPGYSDDSSLRQNTIIHGH